MIYACFARFAKSTPDAPAIIHFDGAQTSYLQAFWFLNALMVVLRNACPDLQVHKVVGVACKSRRLHMFLMFALEALGVTSMTFVQPIDPAVSDAVTMCDLFIGEERPANHKGRFVKLDRAFFDQVVQLAGQVTAQPAIWGPERTLRLATTSGSTGKAKIVPMPYGATVRRIERRVWLYGFDAQSRLLLAMAMTGPVVQGVQALFSTGGAVVFYNPARLAEHLALATHVTLLPIHLSEILQALPKGYLPLASLKIFCTGAALGPSLREGAVSRLGAQVICPYGTNESGWCAFIDAQGLGTILPGVELEVVDDHFKPVAFGVEGRIRIRSEEMVAGYPDPELTRAHFVNGWFLPGDLGVMPQPGQLRLTGRAQTMLNFGGVKYAPDLIEQRLSEAVQAQDIGVCGSINDEAIEELQIAVVNSRLDDQALVERLRERMGPAFAAFQVFRLDAIPRDASGKVQRQRLKEQLKPAGIRLLRRRQGNESLIFGVVLIGPGRHEAGPLFRRQRPAGSR